MPQPPSSIQLFFFLLFLCNSVRSTDIPHTKDFKLVWEKEQLFPSIHRVLTEYFRYKMTEFDSIDPPTTPLPSAPITNPVTTPGVNTAPGIVTVPGTNPATNPVNPPVPVSNPVTTPTPSTNPPVPVSNPVTTPTPNTNPPVPVNNPVTTPSTNPPAGNGRGQSWCIAKSGASQAVLQSALDYACGIGGADCATIQQGSSCYEPTTLQNHASYAFNSYYQKNPVSTSCDFGGAAALTTTNPSTGSCVYPSSSSSSSTSTPTTPITQAPPTTTPTTQAPVNPTSLPAAPTTTTTSPSSSFPGSTSPGIQSPPPGFSMGNPDPTGLGAFGASPPLVNTASIVSNNLVGALVVVASVIMCWSF